MVRESSQQLTASPTRAGGLVQSPVRGVRFSRVPDRKGVVLEWLLLVLWLLIAAVIVFILWAIRRAEGYRGMPSIHIPRQRADSGYRGKPVAGKRRADRP